jgi:hypothetical protein
MLAGLFLLRRISSGRASKPYGGDMAKRNFNPLLTRYLRDRGYKVENVERWKASPSSETNQLPGKKFSGVHVDLFGFIDFVAMIDGQITAIQSTSKHNMRARIKKICNEARENALAWSLCRGAIQVWGWEQIVEPGLTQAGKPRKRKHWTPTVYHVTLNMLLNYEKVARVEPVPPLPQQTDGEPTE